jgi:uncharacterized Zn finger protein
VIALSATIRAKAERLLTSGRVIVTEADDSSGIFVAAVAGDTGSYTVWRASHGSDFDCDCPAGQRHLPCAHVAATALVAG